MKGGNRFGEFIANLRKENDISQDKLCDGLCTRSMICKFEKGEREPDKLLQNRFLTRLGVVPENYENFLYYEDYCRWEKQQGIIHNILEEHMDEAKKLLEAYRLEYDMSIPLEEQFYLAMLAQIMRHEGCKEEELAELFRYALSLTVPKLEQRGFIERLLSLEELNLLLEYYYCSKAPLQHYEELLEYIENMERTLLAMAKIYPKTVYYYYLAWKKVPNQEKDLAVRLLEVCEKAIELLRNTNRMFYMWELFCMKEELQPLLPKEIQSTPEFQESLEQCRGWRETLEELYRDYGVSIGMYEYCYLYVEGENYCIDDVIRTRRKMLGLSQKTLGEGICDDRTISKVERHLTRPQRDVVEKLFDRLNLSTELNRTELVTDNPEAVEKYREIRAEINKRNHAVVKKLLEECRSMISMEIPSNRQFLMRKEVINRYKCGEIVREEYIRGIKNALECTISYNRVVLSGKKYLTNEEIACIQNITAETDSKYSGNREGISVLRSICAQPKYPENYLRMYEFIMASVASYLGNEGDYDESNKIEHRLIKLLLTNRKGGGLHEAIYEILWNSEQKYQKKNTVPGKKGNEYELKRCINLSAMFRNKVREQFYKEKLICKK